MQGGYLTSESIPCGAKRKLCYIIDDQMDSQRDICHTMSPVFRDALYSYPRRSLTSPYPLTTLFNRCWPAHPSPLRAACPKCFLRSSAPIATSKFLWQNSETIYAPPLLHSLPSVFQILPTFPNPLCLLVQQLPCCHSGFRDSLVVLHAPPPRLQVLAHLQVMHYPPATTS